MGICYSDPEFERQVAQSDAAFNKRMENPAFANSGHSRQALRGKFNEERTYGQNHAFRSNDYICGRQYESMCTGNRTYSSPFGRY
jgi:hypothetical protein